VRQRRWKRRISRVVSRTPKRALNITLLLLTMGPGTLETLE
jgi:hypothetical protein